MLDSVNNQQKISENESFCGQSELLATAAALPKIGGGGVTTNSTRGSCEKAISV